MDSTFSIWFYLFQAGDISIAVQTWHFKCSHSSVLKCFSRIFLHGAQLNTQKRVPEKCIAIAMS